LREATSETHARLHLHPGFAAIQDGTIDLAGYRALLARLYGFHAPFEAAVGIAADRSSWLQDDLRAVTQGACNLANIPRCESLTAFDTPARRLGALYVIEGSTLGGRQLARNLDALLGSAGTAGRRFFLGRGAETSVAWNAFLSRLTSAASSPAMHAEIVGSAVRTFDIFQEWMHAWRNIPE
jgi:heme oxygenase